MTASNPLNLIPHNPSELSGMADVVVGLEIIPSESLIEAATKYG
jgi:hypothetical protein